MANIIEMMHLGPGPNYRPGLGEFVMHGRHVAFVISVGKDLLTVSKHERHGKKWAAVRYAFIDGRNMHPVPPGGDKLDESHRGK